LTTLPATYSPQELRLLRLLSDRFPTVTAAHIEMMNLSAILALPKGTDHYVSDIHGAFEQFEHILRHASGAVRRKISQTFGAELSTEEQINLAMLVYYPEAKLRQVAASVEDAENAAEALRVWSAQSITALVRVARTAAQKYTRSKVRKRLEPGLSYLLEELLNETSDDHAQKEHYYRSIVRSILELGEGEKVIVTLAYLIQSLVIDRLNVLGDIYDRGPAAEKVMDRLIASPEVSVQWGNHDISWMGAAAGCPALVANVVRLSLRYANLETLVGGYGVDLWSLARFAEAVYEGDSCAAFAPKAGARLEGYTPELIARMHKAITVIQFKLEAQIIKRHPEYEMDDRLVLQGIDLEAGTVTLGGARYPLLDANWPTLGEGNGSALTDGERLVIGDLCEQFECSARLQAHIRFLYAYGNMFEVRDGNLKFHGCLPVDERGDFVAFTLAGEALSGPALLARFEQLARAAFFSHDPMARQSGQDAMWYLWCGKHSPLYGRLRMTTFERYVLADPATHREPKGAYYALRDSEAFCRKVLAVFGADAEDGLIINGHTPVRVRKGERPLMAGGKLVIIDGGMSEAYRSVTGIAGYTLIANSHELVLAAHEPFMSADEMIAQRSDSAPGTERLKAFAHRMLIAETDIGRSLRAQLSDLHKLVDAYRSGVLVERPQLASTGQRGAL
jgi:fructose-1,6-bisphosphatase-3